MFGCQLKNGSHCEPVTQPSWLFMYQFGELIHIQDRCENTQIMPEPPCEYHTLNLVRPRGSEPRDDRN
jgi:hypothetical protein